MATPCLEDFVENTTILYALSAKLLKKQITWEACESYPKIENQTRSISGTRKNVNANPNKLLVKQEIYKQHISCLDFGIF